MSSGDDLAGSSRLWSFQKGWRTAMNSFSGLWRSFNKEISGAPDLYVIVGILISIAFGPVVIFLATDLAGGLMDIFPGSRLVLPWALVISSAVLLGGLFVLFKALSYATSPGTFLYRLTHLRLRSR